MSEQSGNIQIVETTRTDTLTDADAQTLKAILHGYYSGSTHGGYGDLFDRGLAAYRTSIGGLNVTPAGYEALKRYDEGKNHG